MIIYFIGAYDLSMTKIGESATMSGVKKRLSDLQVGNGCKLKVYGTIEIGLPGQAKRVDDRVRETLINEYGFKLTPANNEWVCGYAKNIYQFVKNNSHRIPVRHLDNHYLRQGLCDIRKKFMETIYRDPKGFLPGFWHVHKGIRTERMFQNTMEVAGMDRYGK